MSDHEEWHGLVGAHALGHLHGAELDRLQAHLDGCARCRADLADLAPLAGLLDGLDPEGFGVPAAPPADLGARIRTAMEQEPRQPVGVPQATVTPIDRLDPERPRPGRRRAQLLGVAAAVVMAAGVGGVVGRASAPEPAEPPLEAVAVRAVDDGGAAPAIASSDLIAHTWGVELVLEGRGFVAGEVYRASFRTDDGRWQPAGQFLGTGERPLLCRLQSAVLRDDVDAVRITDAEGRVVARARLAPAAASA